MVYISIYSLKIFLDNFVIPPKSKLHILILLNSVMIFLKCHIWKPELQNWKYFLTDFSWYSLSMQEKNNYSKFTTNIFSYRQAVKLPSRYWLEVWNKLKEHVVPLLHGNKQELKENIFAVINRYVILMLR